MFPDLRSVLRTLARQRGFACVTILTLALGIGSAASIFSVTDWILFRAHAYPSDVYLIGGQPANGSFLPIRFDLLARAYAERTDVMSDYAKAWPQSGNIVLAAEPVHTSWLAVSPNLLPMLDVTPAIGRGFLPEEAVEGANGVVIVSDAFSRQHLGGPEKALGQTLTVDGTPCTVIGVLRRGQLLPPFFMHAVYRPLVYRTDPTKPWEPNLFVLGRLNAGVSREQATAALRAVKPDVPVALKPFVEQDQVALSSLAELNDMMRPEIYWVQVGAVAFLYAIACLNASNLMLVRMIGLRREMSIRLALGAGRWRVIRLLALEGLTLAVAGSLFGLLVANWLFPLLLQVAGSAHQSFDWTSWHLGERVLAVMALLTLASSLLIVVIPAWRILRTDISSGLKEGGAALGESPALARLRGGFVVLQAAFAVILLTGAGLMIRTFDRLREVELGFDPTGRAKLMVAFPADYPTGQEERLARLGRIADELRRIPGVRAVGVGTDLLLPGYHYESHQLEGPEGRPVGAQMAMFVRGYQEAAGLTLLRGRWLDQVNGNEVMVNESLARALWPKGDPIGQLVRPIGGNPSAGNDWKGWVVAGVVRDVRSTVRDAPKPYLYGPEGWGAPAMNVFVLHLSGEYDATVSGLIRRQLFRHDPRLVVVQVTSVQEVRDLHLWAERTADSVLKVLATIAALLTLVGMYSVIAYTVDRRMGEFGVRLALGATTAHLTRLVLRRGLGLAVVGVLAGSGGALALGRYLRSLLFEVSPQDPGVLVMVAIAMVLTALLACSGPARRAARADVSRLLRADS